MFKNKCNAGGGGGGLVYENVKCEECKHLIERSDAQEIKVAYSWSRDKGVYYYCPMHKKSYDRVLEGFWGILYFGEVEMDKNGTPIGYTKIQSGSNVASFSSGSTDLATEGKLSTLTNKKRGRPRKTL